nr:uncharacterized protein LOC127483230 [Oryctolagus cuniculus]
MKQEFIAFKELLKHLVSRIGTSESQHIHYCETVTRGSTHPSLSLLQCLCKFQKMPRILQRLFSATALQSQKDICKFQGGKKKCKKSQEPGTPSGSHVGGRGPADGLTLLGHNARLGLINKVTEKNLKQQPPTAASACSRFQPRSLGPFPGACLLSLLVFTEPPLQGHMLPPGGHVQTSVEGSCLARNASPGWTSESPSGTGDLQPMQMPAASGDGLGNEMEMTAPET